MTDDLRTSLKSSGRPYVRHEPKHAARYCKTRNLFISEKELCRLDKHLFHFYCKKHNGMPLSKISFSVFILDRKQPQWSVNARSPAPTVRSVRLYILTLIYWVAAGARDLSLFRRHALRSVPPPIQRIPAAISSELATPCNAKFGCAYKHIFTPP